MATQQELLAPTYKDPLKEVASWLQLFSPPLEPTSQRDSSSELSFPPARQETRSKQFTLPLPLTQDNLRRLQRSLCTNDSTMQSRISNMGFDRMKIKDRLQLFGISYEDRAPIPRILAQHILNLKKPREAPLQNAKQIQEILHAARLMSEQDGISMVKDLLLPVPANRRGTQYVADAVRPNLNGNYFPVASDFLAGSLSLGMTQPDHCFGYIRLDQARLMRLEAPFAVNEENIMNRFALTTGLYFPFFTAEWKNPEKGQSHHQAIPQGARVGSTIVNYLNEFYAEARPTQKPSLIETCHFSATIDMRSIILWVHWREQDENGDFTHHMEQVECGMLDKERDNEEIQTILLNLQDHALGDRLRGIKELLPVFGERFSQDPTRMIRDNSSTQNLSTWQTSTLSALSSDRAPKRRRR